MNVNEATAKGQLTTNGMATNICLQRGVTRLVLWRMYRQVTFDPASNPEAMIKSRFIPGLERYAGYGDCNEIWGAAACAQRNAHAWG